MENMQVVYEQVETHRIMTACGERSSVMRPDEQPLGSSLACNVEQGGRPVHVVHHPREPGKVLFELWCQRRLNQANVPARIDRLEAE